MAIPVEHVKELYSGIVRSNTIFMYVLALIFCSSTILVVRLISRALLGVVSNLDQVAEGRLNFDISTKLVNRTDEVGKIARAVHSVVVGFSRIITNIHSSMQEMDEFTGTFSSNFDSIGQSISAVNTAVNDCAGRYHSGGRHPEGQREHERYEQCAEPHSRQCERTE